jgi:hypothetical protein
MGELVSLEQWKHDREMEEIRELRRRLEDAAVALGPDPEPMPYYPSDYHVVPDAGLTNEIAFNIGVILRDVIREVMGLDKVDKVEESGDEEE